jgi:hypothetical protein
MKQNEVLLLLGGAALLYFLYLQSQGQNAAQVALNTNALNTQNTLSNTNILANSGTAIAGDLSTLANIW